MPVPATMEEKGEWLAEAVDRSTTASHKMLKDVESRLHSSMEDRFHRLEDMIANLQQPTSLQAAAMDTSRTPMVTASQSRESHMSSSYPPADQDSRHSHGLSQQTSQQQPTLHSSDGLPPTALTAPSMGRGMQSAQAQPTCASTVATGQLSDALRQLSLVVENTPDKIEGMLYRPEWYAQRKLKDMPMKSLDYSKLSLNELHYGMTCVLEYLLQSGNKSWPSYIQHMKYVSRQASSNNYVDQAFCGYDRMVIDKYLEDTSQGFQAGDIISVSSNFHAANFRREQVKPVLKKARRGQKNRYEGEEPVEVPESWPSDICYYYNRRSCYGRCNRSHICHKCRGNHRDLECKNPEKKN